MPYADQTTPMVGVIFHTGGRSKPKIKGAVIAMPLLSS
jgi:hypothetical protein